MKKRTIKNIESWKCSKCGEIKNKYSVWYSQSLATYHSLSTGKTCGPMVDNQEPPISDSLVYNGPPQNEALTYKDGDEVLS